MFLDLAGTFPVFSNVTDFVVEALLLALVVIGASRFVVAELDSFAEQLVRFVRALRRLETACHDKGTAESRDCRGTDEREESGE